MNRNHASRSRKGAALVIALALVALAIALVMQAARLVTLNRSTAESDARVSQARALLEFGVMVLESKRNADIDLQDEVINIALQHDGYTQETDREPAIGSILIERIAAADAFETEQWRVSASINEGTKQTVTIISRATSEAR